MNASSTHDTKRSEDVRARINVLSELPDEWDAALDAGAVGSAGPHARGAPDANEQVLIDSNRCSARGRSNLERLKQYVTKALREGKTHTSWINIDETL